MMSWIDFLRPTGYSWVRLVQEIARPRNRPMCTFDDAPVSDFIWDLFWIVHPAWYMLVRSNASSVQALSPDFGSGITEIGCGAANG